MKNDIITILREWVEKEKNISLSMSNSNPYATGELVAWGLLEEKLIELEISIPTQYSIEEYPSYEQTGGDKKWEDMSELEQAYYNISKLRNALDVSRNTIKRLKEKINEVPESTPTN